MNRTVMSRSHSNLDAVRHSEAKLLCFFFYLLKSFADFLYAVEGRPAVHTIRTDVIEGNGKARKNLRVRHIVLATGYVFFLF